MLRSSSKFSPRLALLPSKYKTRCYIPARTLFLQRLFHASLPVFNTTEIRTGSSRICPSCSNPLPTPLPACNRCWYISRPPINLTYHEIFDIPYEPNPFVIDIPTLRNRFRAAQTICHPDSWASKGSDKRDEAEKLSSWINHAYQALLKPLPRIEYILSHHGLGIQEGDMTEVADMGFIEGIMDTFEQLEVTDDDRVVQKITRDNNARMEEITAELKELVGKKDWKSVMQDAMKLKYLESVDRAAMRLPVNH